MTKEKRKILFVSERRADYSRLKPIMNKIKQSKKLELQLIVTGMHLLKRFGETKNNIIKDNFKIDATVPIFNEDDKDDGASMVQAMGRALSSFPDIFKKLRPTIIFSGFDIGANLAAAITGMHMNIHVAHIQGGEVSGTIDEVLRHAMTKFSHIHFAATKKSVQRIIRLGENPKYVFNVGSPSLDTIRKITYYSKEEMAKKYNLDPSKPLIIMLQHPVTSEESQVVSQIEETINAIQYIKEKFNTQAIAIYSNNDAGGKRIVNRLDKTGIQTLAHIPYEDFLRLLKVSDVLVGNSSTGIHETPSLKLATVNIGTREQFREKAKNVIDVSYKQREIIKAIEKSLFDKKFKKIVNNAKNPYDNGDVAEKVVKILETITLPPIQKVITY